MRRIPVEVPAHGAKPYDVIISGGLLDEAGKIVKTMVKPCKALIFTDNNVVSLYADRVEKSLANEGFKVFRFVYESGEDRKNLQTVEEELNYLTENEFTRTDLIVALGGGISGDLAGFTASIYLRGIDFIQIPTTLLAMVDSSVGGKTGCNLAGGKNLAGAFYQPRCVICDPDVLETLPSEQFACGVAEAVKTGILGSTQLFDLFRGRLRKNDIPAVIEECVSIKARIVQEDEKEAGIRKVLNLGHTVGHAIEKISSYTIPHGYAVATGMSIITRACAKEGICSSQTAQDIVTVLKENGLPVETSFSSDEIYSVAVLDKKRKNDVITLVLPQKIGSCLLKEYDVKAVKSFFEKGLT